MRNSSIGKWLSIAGLVIVLDHLSKWWVSSTLDFQETVPVLSFFSVVLIHNHGAAFSFLADAGGNKEKLELKNSLKLGPSFLRFWTWILCTMLSVMIPMENSKNTFPIITRSKTNLPNQYKDFQDTL